MIEKGFKQLLMEANAVVETVAAEAALEMAGGDDVVFVDVRERHEYAQGHIPGSLHAPRGLLEFIADPAGPMHQQAFASGKKLLLVCGTGGRGALACKTLREMGIENLANLGGGIMAWAEAGGPLEQ
jgi:rhodanese-related sulfurtransferase